MGLCSFSKSLGITERLGIQLYTTKEMVYVLIFIVSKLTGKPEEYTMKYKTFPKDGSERSNLQHQIKIKDPKLTPADLDDLVTCIELSTSQIKKEDAISLRDINFSDFKLHIKKKCLLFDQKDIEILIYKCKKSIKEYFNALSALLEDIDDMKDSLSEIAPEERTFDLTLDLIYTDSYFEIRKRSEVVDFIRALKLDLFFINTNFLVLEDIDLEANNFKFFNYKRINELPQISRFCILQYEVILKEILLPSPENEKKDDSTINYGNGSILIVTLQKYPKAYNAFMRALNDGIIIFTPEETFNFKMSPPEIKDFLSNGGFNNWKLLSENAETDGNIITESIRSSNPTINSKILIKKYYT